MTTAREIMSADVTCVRSGQTLVEAARMLRDLDVGALPVCGDDDRLQGMLSDRDIVVRCLAEDGDPRTTTAADLAGGRAITVGADDDVQVALETMAHHQVRRLAVIEGHRLVGIVSQADLARVLPPERIGSLVTTISY